MNLKTNLKHKADDLIAKASVLSDINIVWENCISIKCKDLTNIKTLEKRNVLDVFYENRNRPAIYYFEIKSNLTAKTIVDALQVYKDKKLRSCPKIDKNRELCSRYLYCGSCKEGLRSRFIQHLGFGSQNTFALQLLHWTKKLNIELEFHYAWLDDNQKQFTELVESALADKIKPLVGKIA